MSIQEVNQPSNEIGYVEITEEELKKYPVLEKAQDAGYSLEMNNTEWEQTRAFLQRKGFEVAGEGVDPIYKIRDRYYHFSFIVS